MYMNILLFGTTGDVSSFLSALDGGVEAGSGTRGAFTLKCAGRKAGASALSFEEPFKA